MKKSTFFRSLVGLLMLSLLILGACKKEDSKPSRKITASDYSTNSIELEWDAVSGADYYVIEYASVYDEDDFDADEAYFYEIGETDEEEFTHSGLYEESTYAYRVTAYNEDDDDIYEFPIVFGKTVGVVEFFEGMADATGGTLTEYDGADELDEVILSVIADYIDPNTDLVFLIDMTGSMYDDINTVQSAIGTFIDALPSGVNVGVANYGDNNVDAVWYLSSPLESSPYTNTLEFISSMTTSGGGDTPESVYDGIYETVDVMEWSKPNKAIIVIGDAGPLEGELTNYSRDEVIAKCTEAGIAVNLYPIILSSGYKSGRTNTQK